MTYIDPKDLVIVHKYPIFIMITFLKHGDINLNNFFVLESFRLRFLELVRPDSCKILTGCGFLKLTGSDVIVDLLPELIKHA